MMTPSSLIHSNTPIYNPVPRFSFYRLVEANYYTICGNYHNTNQDRALIKNNFYGVADGVGGGINGEVAAHTILSHCSKAKCSDRWKPGKLWDWIHKGDFVVRDALKSLDDKPGATTFAGLWLNWCGNGFIAHVGDARIYKLVWDGRIFKLVQLTRDQTYRNLGENPPIGGSLDDPARMIGVGAVRESTVIPFRLDNNDIILICSDGLHRFVPDEKIVQHIQGWIESNTDLKDICIKLTELAQNDGGYDDVTVMLLRWKPRWYRLRLILRQLLLKI